MCGLFSYIRNMVSSNYRYYTEPKGDFIGAYRVRKGSHNHLGNFTSVEKANKAIEDDKLEQSKLLEQSKKVRT